MKIFDVNSLELKKYFDFFWAFTEKEIKVRYKRAIFGFLWVILNPLLQMVVIGIIFSVFMKVPDYFLLLFSGLLPWGFFSLSLSKATSSFVNEGALFKKCTFPKELVLFSIIFSDVVHMIVSMMLLFLFLIFTGKLYFPQILLFILGIIWLLIFTIGFSLITATLQVRYRDISFFVKSILVFWFYATPILYDLTMIPKSLYVVFLLNPLTTIFEIFHLAVLNRGVIVGEIFFVNLLLTILIFILGVMIFRKENKYFVDWL